MTGDKNRKVLALIPARYQSTRFPGKPLADIGGKSMIQRTYEQAGKGKSIYAGAGAPDDGKNFRHVEKFGGRTFLTRDEHPSGTDRIAEVATKMKDFEIIVNVQGDEPFIHPQQINDLIAFITASDNFQIATLARKIQSTDDLFNPNVVKVVKDLKNKALYFSRCPIPYFRGMEGEKWLTERVYFQHIGMYAFKRETLLNITKLAPSELEKTESLEQLRWLENGYSIGVLETEFSTISVDAPEDLLKLKDFLAEKNI